MLYKYSIIVKNDTLDTINIFCILKKKSKKQAMLAKTIKKASPWDNLQDLYPRTMAVCS